jgi:hypothetical protein
LGYHNVHTQWVNQHCTHMVLTLAEDVAVDTDDSEPTLDISSA